MQNANTIAELAVAIPEAITVFERLGIDYCCNGGRTIQRACADAGITSDELLQMIAKVEKSDAPARAWEAEPLSLLIRHVNDTHHVYTRESLQRLTQLAAKVRTAHGENHQELYVVERLVAELTADLVPHMLKEEQVLFPFVVNLERACEEHVEPPVPFFGTVKNPVRMMMLEHETVGEKLAELRGVTMDYLLPDDACTSYKVLFEGLIALEADLHQHIHLENNILFPRALELENGAATSPLVGALSERHNCSCHS